MASVSKKQQLCFMTAMLSCLMIRITLMVKNVFSFWVYPFQKSFALSAIVIVGMMT
jgi:hypothetical protein